MNRDYFNQLEHEAKQDELAEKIERDERMAVAPEVPFVINYYCGNEDEKDEMNLSEESE